MLEPPRPPEEPLIPKPEWRIMSRDAVTMGVGTGARTLGFIRSP